MIIDCHTHVDRKFGWEHTADDVIKFMEQYKIDKAIITTYNDIPGEDPDAYDRFIDAINLHRDKFLGGFLRVNPWYSDKAVELFEQSTKKGVIGLKFHPVTIVVSPHHPSVVRLLKKAGELRLPALFHTGDDPMSLPHHIDKAAEACPETILIMGHMGGFFYVAEAVKIAKRRKNVILEISGMPYPHMIRKAIDILGPRKLVFGSDMPAMHPGLELAKLDSARVSDEEKDLILHRNIVDILNLKAI